MNGRLHQPLREGSSPQSLRWPSVRSLAILILVSLLTACASITDRRQFVRVVTPKPHTRIFQDGEWLSTGTSTVRLTREKKPILEFETNNKRVTHTLKTKYRWGHSFAGNALLLMYAPAGWVIDLLSGAAWHIEPPPSSRPKTEKFRDLGRVLILPPTSRTGIESLRAGQQAELWLKKKYPRADVIPFQRGFSMSLGQGFDHEWTQKEKDLNDLGELLYQSKARYIVFSNYENDQQELSLTLVNPYTEKTIARHKITNLILEEKQDSSSEWLMKQSFGLLPNTFSMGAITTLYTTCANQGIEPRYCAGAPRKSPLSVISSISLTNIVHYRKRSLWGTYLRLYPDVTLSFNNIDFEKQVPGLPDISLDWYFASVGYGVRASFVIPVGELFFEINPFWAINHLRLYSSNSDSTQWTGKIGTATQLGLNSWISNRWNMRIFARFQGQRLTVPGIENVDPGSSFDGFLGLSQTGISIGYYFHEEKSELLIIL